MKPNVLGWFLANSSCTRLHFAYIQMFTSPALTLTSSPYDDDDDKDGLINRIEKKKKNEEKNRSKNRKGKTGTDIDFVAITIWNMQTGNQLANCPKRNTLCIWLFKINPDAQQKLNYIIETNFRLSSWFFHILRAQQMYVLFFLSMAVQHSEFIQLELKNRRKTHMNIYWNNILQAMCTTKCLFYSNQWVKWNRGPKAKNNNPSIHSFIYSSRQKKHCRQSYCNKWQTQNP